MVLLLIGISNAFGYFMALYEVPQMTGALMQKISTEPWVIFLMINILLFILGTFLDMAATILICTPIFMPIAMHFGMDPMQFGIMLLISGPSVLLAALQLRTRNLALLLDADGWAVNASAFINLPFGRSLTQMAALPPGSSRDLADPFAEKKSRLPFFLTVLVIIVAGAAGLWAAGIITVPGL